MIIKLKAEYSPAEYEAMGAALRLIIKRAEKALQYGPDMPSSRALLLNDIGELAGWAFVDSEVMRIKEAR